MKGHVTGIFSDTEAAERAVHELIQHDFSPNSISIVVSDQEGEHEETVEHDSGVAEGAAVGATVGGILGILGATLVATGLVTAPGLSIFATGPILAALRGAVMGVGAGGAVGALAGLGFWEDEAHIHVEALKEGGIVVGVPAEHEQADEARKILTQAGAEHVR